MHQSSESLPKPRAANQPEPCVDKPGNQPVLLVTGASGFLGGEIVRQASVATSSFNKIWGTWHRNPPDPSKGPVRLAQLDISERQQVLDLLGQIRPTAIIHTAYQKAGPDAQAATVNGSRYVAEGASLIGARLVHLSSDVVFSGQGAPYDETARPNPLPTHDYGVAKAEAEYAVRATAPQAVIVRTSLIGRLDPPDDSTAWLVNSNRKGQTVTLFTDEIRCPIWIEDLASALLELAGNRLSGVINVAGPQALSRFEMGERLAGYYGLDRNLILSGLSRGSGLARPTDCTLDTRLAQQLLHTLIRSYDEGFAGHEN
ncbi:MAG: SDR family oxidoreductase [Chloroflexota bacterium]|nr:SDR family oxidoreductase [Chloroflexota bacterium]